MFWYIPLRDNTASYEVIKYFVLWRVVQDHFLLERFEWLWRDWQIELIPPAVRWSMGCFHEYNFLNLDTEILRLFRRKISVLAYVFWNLFYPYATKGITFIDASNWWVFENGWNKTSIQLFSKNNRLHYNFIESTLFNDQKR